MSKLNYQISSERPYIAEESETSAPTIATRKTTWIGH